MKGMDNMFKESEFQGYDINAMERIYKIEFKEEKKLKKSDEEAHKRAMFFIDYYKYTFKIIA